MREYNNGHTENDDDNETHKMMMIMKVGKFDHVYEKMVSPNALSWSGKAIILDSSRHLQKHSVCGIEFGDNSQLVMVDAAVVVPFVSPGEQRQTPSLPYTLHISHL